MDQPELIGFLVSRTFCEPGLSSGRLAEYCRASDAKDNGLGVAEDSGDLVATGALDIHKERVRVLHQPLQLALTLLLLGEWVQEIFRELQSIKI